MKSADCWSLENSNNEGISLPLNLTPFLKQTVCQCIVKLPWWVQHWVTVARNLQLWYTNTGPDFHLLAWRGTGSLSPWGCLWCHPSGNPAFAFLWDLMAGPRCSDYGAEHTQTRNLAAEQPEEQGKAEWKWADLGKENWEGTKRAVIRNHLKQCC